MQTRIILIFIYLLSIVSANLIITEFGPKVSIVTAFIFIGLDLTLRDYLHESWHRNNLFLKMFTLILSGSLISWFLNKDSGTIAIASCIAFFMAGITDFIIYHLFIKKSKLVKINASNIISSGVDSLVFPYIAFGAFMPMIVFGQFIAKAFGGFIWSLIIKYIIKTIETNYESRN
jgi:uncharacterized PurR-regulated membrane protein YhhQ (DUF165 family)